MKSFLLKKSLLLIVSIATLFTACSEHELLTGNQVPATTKSAVPLGVTELPGITFQEILEIAAIWATNGVETLAPILDAIDIPGDIASVFLRTLKVSTPFPHPNGSGEMINISGVVIVPAETTDSLRFIISPPPTYTQNTAAPSVVFAGELPLLYENFLNYLFFFAINAAQGCAIFIPDYPGFGDSYQQCFHPYAIKDVMVNSTITLAQVAQEALTSYGYTYKREVIVTGYSQGGLVGTAVGRELDLNGEAYNLPVNLIVGGGVPANLTDLQNIARKTFLLPLSFVFPYTILGFKENIAPELVLSDVLRSPYDETCYKVFNGDTSVVEAIAAFPLTNIGLFTRHVLFNNMNNPTVARLAELLAENSIDPWANRAPVKFIHGKKDEAVYYKNITDFVAAMEAVGGTPELITNPATEHVLTLFDYYIRVAEYIAEYK